MANYGTRLPFQNNIAEPPRFEVAADRLQQIARGTFGQEIPENALQSLTQICDTHIGNTALARNATPVSEALKALEKYEKFSEMLWEFWIIKKNQSEAESFATSNIIHELKNYPISVVQQEYESSEIFGEYLIDRKGAEPFPLVLTNFHLAQIAQNYRLAVDQTKAFLENRRGDKEDDSFKQDAANKRFYNAVFDWASEYGLPTGIDQFDDTYAPLSKFVVELLGHFPDGYGERKAIKIQTMSKRILRARENLQDK